MLCCKSSYCIIVPSCSSYSRISSDFVLQDILIPASSHFYQLQSNFVAACAHYCNYISRPILPAIDTQGRIGHSQTVRVIVPSIFPNRRLFFRGCCGSRIARRHLRSTGHDREQRQVQRAQRLPSQPISTRCAASLDQLVPKYRGTRTFLERPSAAQVAVVASTLQRRLLEIFRHATALVGT